MLFPTTVSKFYQLSFNYKTTIKFDQNICFSTVPERLENGKYRFHIYDITGKFQIRYVYSKGVNQYLPYDQRNLCFDVKKCFDRSFEFTIIADIEFKEIDKSQNPYDLYVPYSRIKAMMPLEFYKEKLTVPVNGEILSLNVYVKKIAKHKVHIVVENSVDGLKINGLPGNFEYNTSEKCDIRQKLTFKFDLTAFDEEKQIIKESDTNSIITNDSGESQFTSKKMSNDLFSKWYEIMSNNQYSDVTLISSDNIEISSHRCILAKHSQIFAKIFESQETPAIINVENFNAETIQAALGFLYDKHDSINGKEMEVYKFAINYDINDLNDYCSSYFDEIVVPENVCEYIRIAYFKNFDELKQKCFKVLTEKKDEIDAAEMEILPKNILVDAFRYGYDH